MLCLGDYEKYARENLDRKTWEFYSQGAEREETMKENAKSFTRYKFIPRLLRNVAERDLSVTILGAKVPFPVGISPTAYHKLAHPDGEVASAKAASEMGLIFTLSTAATTSLEEVSEAVNEASPLWFQIYMLEDRSYSASMIRKAEAKGYKALVLTVDIPVPGLQLRSWRNGLKFPPHIKSENLFDAVSKNPSFNPNEPSSYVDIFCKTLTWEDVAWIRSISSLPLILKGILTVDDALKAKEMGAAAVWVSNHGGRQLDGVEATIDALPAIARALDGSGCEVYVDGGIRWGSDVLRALALGARAVFIGRPVLWGLAHSGKEGVKNVLQILKNELDRAMHLIGCKNIEEVGPHFVKKECCSRH